MIAAPTRRYFPPQLIIAYRGQGNLYWVQREDTRDVPLICLQISGRNKFEGNILKQVWGGPRYLRYWYCVSPKRRVLFSKLQLRPNVYTISLVERTKMSRVTYRIQKNTLTTDRRGNVCITESFKVHGKDCMFVR